MGLEDANGDEELWQSVSSLQVGDLTVVITPTLGDSSVADLLLLMPATPCILWGIIIQ